MQQIGTNIPEKPAACLQGITVCYMGEMVSDTGREKRARIVTKSTSLKQWQSTALKRATLVAHRVLCPHSTYINNHFSCMTYFKPWRWRHQVPPKCWHISTKVHRITSQKTVTLTAGLNICFSMTKEAIMRNCKEQKLYLTPHLNDVLYLHYKGKWNLIIAEFRQC